MKKTVPAYEVSKRTKKDQRKTSVGFTLLSVLLHILAIVPVIAVPTVLALRCYELVPYYSFWPFIGVIIAGVFALIFTIVALIVARKNSKGSIRTQTVKIAITYVCITGLFAVILTYVFPDIIGMATQSTLYCEDIYYRPVEQAEHNASLDRDFFMYNLLNGNLNKYNSDGSIAEKGDFSYTTLSQREETSASVFIGYNNEDIQARYDAYMDGYSDVRALQQVVATMEQTNERKYELYDFIYRSYVLNDYDYAFANTMERRAFTLSLVDYIYANFDYEGMLREGFSNPRMKQLFMDNYDNFNQDGYATFDDPLLLYAQRDGRMTVPVIIRLILNGGWTYSQSSFNEYGQPTYTDDGNYLYQLYDPQALQDFIDNGGSFDYEGTLIGEGGAEITVNYGFNEEGWMIFENGVTKRPMNWLVLDMLGDPMALTTVDLAGIGGAGVATIIQQVINMVPKLIDSLGNLVQDELINEVLVEATGGAKLSIGLCIDDDGNLAINLFPMNHVYGMIGYMQATWMDSNNLLMAVINIVGMRNWLAIFSAAGLVLVIAAGVCRDCGRKTRERTQRSRARIARALTNGETLEDSIASEKADKKATSKANAKSDKKADKNANVKADKKVDTKGNKNDAKKADKKVDPKADNKKNAPKADKKKK